MLQDITLKINKRVHKLRVEPDKPQLYILRNDFGLKAAIFNQHNLQQVTS